MKVTIELSDEDRKQALVDFCLKRKIIPADCKIEQVYIALGQVIWTDNFNDEEEKDEQ